MEGARVTVPAAVPAAVPPPEVRGDIQGLITGGYGHLPFSAYLFVHVPARAAGRAWLGALVPQVTTAATWRPAPGQAKTKPACARNVGLTFAGLRALGLSPEALSTFPEEFREGIADEHRSRLLGDTGESAPEGWEMGWPGKGEIHALLILHAGTAEALAAWRETERARMAAAGVVEVAATAQEGYRPTNGKEPFGFRDGIAQPRIAGFGGADVAAGEVILGYPDHFGFVPASPLVLAEDDPGGLLPPDANPYHPPGRFRDFGRHGTYLVYRKLQQDVAGFWRFLTAEAQRLRGRADPAYAVRLAAKMVGRWPDGTPLTLSPDRGDPSLGPRDDFLYSARDPEGRGCPLGAHIRRTNPRDALAPCAPAESLSISSSHRLARRGRVFGPPLFAQEILDDPGDPAGLELLGRLTDDGRPRGIHFLAVCGSLRRQFEFVQQTWANNPRFAGLTDNEDPLIGEDGRPGKRPGFMTIPGAPARVRVGPLPRFVTVRGGGYFFLPGLRALRFLA